MRGGRCDLTQVRGSGPGRLKWIKERTEKESMIWLRWTRGQDDVCPAGRRKVDEDERCDGGRMTGVEDPVGNRTAATAPRTIPLREEQEPAMEKLSAIETT
ncbi:unnamed protein product [Pleuronectes platessa]|uniref:Uncharacterized protein n=1 Tax=Pleuronectes platessa TaxID=8262 RepID=A0A9N7YHP3_PLEPL|nr:unnamed protein product [Pleuronectes platessa]